MMRQIDTIVGYCRKTTRAAVILLPLLGITWLFGLVAVDEDTLIFMYLFVILNSLQVGLRHKPPSALNLGPASLTDFKTCARGLSSGDQNSSQDGILGG